MEKRGLVKKCGNKLSEGSSVESIKRNFPSWQKERPNPRRRKKEKNNATPISRKGSYFGKGESLFEKTQTWGRREGLIGPCREIFSEKR